MGEGIFGKQGYLNKTSQDENTWKEIYLRAERKQEIWPKLSAIFEQKNQYKNPLYIHEYLYSISFLSHDVEDLCRG